jgi:hypothetical protein
VHRSSVIYSIALHLDVSALKLTVLSLDLSTYSSLCCPWTCLSYRTPVLLFWTCLSYSIQVVFPLDMSVLNVTLLPLKSKSFCPTAALCCLWTFLSYSSPLLPLDVSFIQKTVLPLNVAVLQQSVLPLDVCTFHNRRQKLCLLFCMPLSRACLNLCASTTIVRTCAYLLHGR